MRAGNVIDVVCWLGITCLGSACGGGGGTLPTALPDPSNNPAANTAGTPAAQNSTQTGTANTDFVLKSSLPRDGATAVSGSDSLSLEFSANVAPARVTSQAVSLKNRYGEVPATLQTIGTTIKVTPTNRLIPNEAYTLKLDTSIGDLNGNALKQLLQVQFTTGGGNWQTPVFASSGS